MENPEKKAVELGKSLNEFAEPKHMAQFGRPLWFAYEDPKYMMAVAKLKLLGGKSKIAYNGRNIQHVFAAVSFRLSLDVCLQNPTTHPFVKKAVNSYLRLVISMDQDAGVLDTNQNRHRHTITPSEPVVAIAAMDHLCKESNWSTSISTLTEELLDKGMINKGLKGELYSRFVLVLAHDCIQLKSSPLASIPRLIPPPKLTLKETLKSPFTVKEFLMALYSNEHHGSLQHILPEILQAKMNFNHFIPAGENLSFEDVPKLLRDLLRRNAGLQLVEGQPTYDILVPIYFGDPAEPFDISYCGVILIQTKNKNIATRPDDVFQEIFEKVSPKPKSQRIPKAALSYRSIRDLDHGESKFVFNKMKNPILFLLFDLGITRAPKATSPIVQVSRSTYRKPDGSKTKPDGSETKPDGSETKPDVWAVHSRGHDNTVFGCLNLMQCERSAKNFFMSTNLENNSHDNLCRRNKTFSSLKEGFRYTNREVKRKRDSSDEDADEDAEEENKNQDTDIDDGEKKEEEERKIVGKGNKNEYRGEKGGARRKRKPKSKK
jgi:hypothetical protein